MAKVPIHFKGFLANVGDDSITKLRLGDGFVIGSNPPSIENEYSRDIAPFFEQIRTHWGQSGLDEISPEGSYHVVKLNFAESDAIGGACMATHSRIHEKAHIFVQNRLRLLRLVKEGNVVLAYSFLYYGQDSEPTVSGPTRDCLIVDRMPLTLTPAEVLKAQSLIDSSPFPLPEPWDLAFMSFELSYRTHDFGLKFLSLMTAMEVLLNPSDHELRYRVSRNAGVLLGRDSAEGESIFKEMKGLYDKRSKLVHTGDKLNVTRDDVLRLRHYVRETIKEAMSSRMSKDELLKTLNACGFGQRPWRESGK